MASAQTTRPALSASLGFAGVFKPDSWTPVYARVADADAPRAATLEVRTARGKLGHDIIARIATTLQPSTYTLYAPIGTLDRVTLQLRDGRGTLLQSTDLTDAAQQTPAALGGPAFGVAGATADAQPVVNQLVNDTGEYVAAGAIATKLLPERTIGYAAIDALVLPELDADAMPNDVQAAIVSWVRSGGIVVAWPGAQGWTRTDAPLVSALPADVGEPVAVSIEGHAIDGRLLQARPGSSTFAVPLDPSLILQRRLGLGQIVLLAFDPTRVPNFSADERITLWRRLTSGQLSLSQNDRRVGVFDPLVAQAVGEQQLAVPEPPPPSVLRTMVIAGFALGLLLGPGEFVLLAVARRHPRTWYTPVGVALTLGCGVWWSVLPAKASSIAQKRFSVRIEAPDGLAASIALSTTPGDADSTTWLTADRTDPSLQPATELRLAQRDAAIDITGIDTIGTRQAKLRSIRFASDTLHPSHINFDVTTSTITNATQTSVDGVAIVRRDNIRVAEKSIAPGAAISLSDIAPTPADNASTRRVETGIEKLASVAGWEVILMDRRLSERLVRILETEDATIVATRATNGAITVQVLRS